MYEVGTIDFAVYEDKTEFIGIANLKLPDKNQKTITMNGSGISGDVDIPVNGHYDSMALEMSFRAYSAKVAKLREQRRHKIECHICQQNEDPQQGQIIPDAVKHVFVVIPKGASGGTVAPASPMDTTVTFSVLYWAIYINGKKVDELDPLNRVEIISGIDYGAAVRKALGKA